MADGDVATLGNYRLLACIGQGAMGAVWRAEHAVIGRPAAIKVLHHSAAGNAAIVARFFDEARAAHQVGHPGIVEVIDCGVDATHGPFLIMELLVGETLAARIERRVYLSLSELLPLLDQVADVLDATHAAGIVHRDLKPENLFCVDDARSGRVERVKVLDFGVAQLLRDDQPRRTQSNLIVGTPLYMSPEQCASAKHVDYRADIYSLGCIAFEALCGAPPFQAEGAGRILAMHQYEAAPDVCDRAPWLPPAVGATLTRALAKDPADRHGSAAALVLDLAGAFELVGDASVGGPRWQNIALPSTQPNALPATQPNPLPATQPSPGPIPQTLHAGRADPAVEADAAQLGLADTAHALVDRGATPRPHARPPHIPPTIVAERASPGVLATDDDGLAAAALAAAAAAAADDDADPLPVTDERTFREVAAGPQWLDCPRCVAPLVPTPYGDVEVDRCLDCRGIWLDYGEARDLVRSALLGDSGETLAAGVPSLLGARGRPSTLGCPACGEPLDAYALRAAPDTEVDRCGLCGGMWLDHGELAEMQRGAVTQLVNDLSVVFSDAPARRPAGSE